MNKFKIFFLIKQLFLSFEKKNNKNLSNLILQSLF